MNNRFKIWECPECACRSYTKESFGHGRGCSRPELVVSDSKYNGEIQYLGCESIVTCSKCYQSAPIYALIVHTEDCPGEKDY